MKQCIASIKPVGQSKLPKRVGIGATAQALEESETWVGRHPPVFPSGSGSIQRVLRTLSTHTRRPLER
jgi:hypothetical protein